MIDRAGGGVNRRGRAAGAAGLTLVGLVGAVTAYAPLQAAGASSPPVTSAPVPSLLQSLQQLLGSGLPHPTSPATTTTQPAATAKPGTASAPTTTRPGATTTTTTSPKSGSTSSGGCSSSTKANATPAPSTTTSRPGTSPSPTGQTGTKSAQPGSTTPCPPTTVKPATTTTTTAPPRSTPAAPTIAKAAPATPAASPSPAPGPAASGPALASLLAPVGGSAADGQGYWLANAAGSVYSYGDAHAFPAQPVGAKVVGVTATPDGGGYWLVTADGGVNSFGDAKFFGSAANTHLVAPAVSLTATPDGQGYWVATADGGVNSFGDAAFFGSAAATHLATPAVGLTATSDGQGYWVATADGGVQSFGDAAFFGSLAGSQLAAPAVSLTATPDGQGYWVATADGGVAAFGDARSFGVGSAQHVTSGVVGLTSTPDGGGYWLATSGGGVAAFGDAHLFGAAPAQQVSGPVVGLVVPVATPTSQIPLQYLTLDHQAAATCPGLPWAILSGIGAVESDFGQSNLPGVKSGANPAGAAGPMQVGIGGQAGGTFFAYDHPVASDQAANPPGSANPPSPWDPADSVYAAARYLCTNGGAKPATLSQALFAYNHLASYGDEVQALASFYEGHGVSGNAVQLAMSQLGTAYVWGGVTANVGFDCSGLVQWVYAQLGLQIPRTSEAQWAALPHLSPSAPLTPGALVFFGPPTGPTHVGLYIGNGLMIDAPHTGAFVRVEPYLWPDYIGAAIP